MGTLNETHEATKELFMEIYHEFQEARKAVQTAVNEADLKIAYNQYEKMFSSHNIDSELDDRTGTFCEIIRELTKDEADIDDVGMMYMVRFTSDGFETAAFEDELTEVKYMCDIVRERADSGRSCN